MELTTFLLAAKDHALTAQQLQTMNDNNPTFDRTLGLTYTAVSADCVRATVDVHDHLRQATGLVHGGVYCAIAESVGSVAAIVASGEGAVGVNNSTDFLASVSDGIIEAEARPLQRGRRTQVWEITMTNGGRIVAKSTLRTMAPAKS